MTRPIEDGLFVASGTGLRSFTKEAVIEAPVEEVWAAWATDAGWGRIYGPPAASRIDLAVGGRYEWLFDGETGSNGCQVLSYVPNRMVSFSWNAPPSQPESREKRTWVVVECERLDQGGTRVRVTHLGFGQGPAWDETRDYLFNAWGRVLKRMQDSLGNSRTGDD
jgi:uncharacterized protein YndB with AHSA1/START domain